MRPRPLQMHRFNQLVPARRRLERPRGPRIMRALHVPDQPEIFPVRIVFLIFFFLRLGDLPPVGIENALAVQIVRQIHRRVLIVLRILRAQRNRRRRRGQLLHLRPRKIVVARARVPRRPPAATPRKRRRRPAHVNARVVPSGRPVAGSPTAPRAAARAAGRLRILNLLHRVVALRHVQFPGAPKFLAIGWLWLIRRNPWGPGRIPLRPRRGTNRPRTRLRSHRAGPSHQRQRAQRAKRHTSCWLISAAVLHDLNSLRISLQFQ